MPRKKTTRKRTARKTTTRRSTMKRKPAKRRTAKKAAGRRKTTARKRKTTTRKKTATRKKATAATAAKRQTPKTAKHIAVGSLKQPYTKSQIMNYLAESTELSKKDISNVFDALHDLMHQHLNKGRCEFTVPGLMKCVVKRKPATKARQGINPFTGEQMTFKAKPARKVVKVRPLKKLKEMVE